MFSKLRHRHLDRQAVCLVSEPLGVRVHLQGLERLGFRAPQKKGDCSPRDRHLTTSECAAQWH